MIKICVFSSKNPFKIKIRGLDGKLYLQNLINRNWMEFWLCNTNKAISVRAEWQGQVQTAYFKPLKTMCQRVNFCFQFNTPQPSQQKIILLDKNYDIPIQSAILNFK